MGGLELNYRTVRTELRAIEQPDLAYAHGLLSHPTVAPHVRFRGTSVAPHEFSAAFYDGLLVSHLAVSRSSGRPVGILMMHGASIIDGYSHMSLVSEPAVTGSGLLIEAGIAFLSFAFDTWPLRKVYFEATDNTLKKYGSVLRRCGEEEGCMRAHAFADGDWQDVHVVAIYREQFLRYRDIYLPNVIESAIDGGDHE